MLDRILFKYELNEVLAPMETASPESATAVRGYSGQRDGFCKKRKCSAPVILYDTILPNYNYIYLYIFVCST